jgi:tight adherence protein C
MNEGSFTLSLWVLSILAGFFMYLFVKNLLQPEEVKETISDIEVRQIKSTSSFARLRPQENIRDRFAMFLLNKLKLQQPLEDMWLLLGSPAKPQPVDILFWKINWAIFLPLVFIVITRNPLFILLCIIGFYIPDMQLKAKVQKRQQDMLGNFATTVDLMALIIESGLDYMTAFERIIKIAKNKTLLEVEIEKTLNETKLGYSRREALERLAQRTGVQDIRSFVGLIVQSDELGTSLVELLRNFSIDLRFRRLNKAEKLAAQASTKMLIPMFIFIFPVVFVLMLAPMLGDLLSGGLF